MDIGKVPAGRNPPDQINVVIEVPLGGDPVKYEFDKKSSVIFVDRFLHTSMRYPCNYGLVPHTLADDGDPVDVLIAARAPVIPGVIVRARPVGVLLMEDEAGLDEKLLAVPVDAFVPVLFQCLRIHGPAPYPARPDRALLPALQGSRTGQMGQDPALGRGRRSPYHDDQRNCRKLALSQAPMLAPTARFPNVWATAGETP